MNGTLTREQSVILAAVVRDRVVHDLGAGSGELSDILVELGATKVIAIDKDWRGSKNLKNVEVHPCYFHDFAGPDPDVAFLSWPVNWHVNGLVELLEKARLVIYLGTHTGGSACGWSGLFDHLLSRTIVIHAPHWKNTLTVYGPRCDRRGPRTGEEHAMVTRRIWSYDEAEALVSGRSTEHASSDASHGP
jgi:hypothetical protein